MTDKRDKDPPREKDRDERVSIQLDPEEALSGLLKVDPDADAVGGEDQESGASGSGS